MARPIREKHDGALTGRMDVRVWLRMLSCTTTIEKRLRRRFSERFGTTLPRFDVLAALEREADGLSMGELSKRLLVSNGNVTALVRQLEKAGYITSRPAPDDRRSWIVSLTETGRAHFTEMAAAHHASIKSMLAGVSREELAALYRLLAVMKASIGAEHANGEFE
ncbi:MarR family winged helix-turn-helix transcriptional regulator [Sphingomonas flavalba]|uniref:MarR family winged helix-turn-helix transcriptional regulator n=1 Tax=Sphingomonas flavalba TaxID=2559804 RepID=UPI001EF004A7|nr:MarR family transcriptional regulator [Sphingomonas flavalba]